MNDFKTIQEKWQKKWQEDSVFRVIKNDKPKYYVLEMFPYPSGSGLHMGHAFNYTIGDIQARYRRMKGFNVLYPMGYDALGLPAENAAIKAGKHPGEFTDLAINNFIKQQKELGLSYDWDRLVKTCDPKYYKWNQYFFLKFLQKGLIYKKKSPVNWCPDCNTVLANEQVHGGKCWRHEETDVEIRHLEQWFIKTTDYAEELLDNIEALDWPERIKAMQKNWIGKSHGTQINFKINGEDWPIFTTRPDTIFGVTFMVISAQHPKLMDIVSDEQKDEVKAFLKKIKSVSEKEAEELEKEGAFTGCFAENPLTGEKIPVYAGNFVVADYGSGMVMAVPAHDQRDFEFAKKYDIPIKVVIQPESFDLNVEKMARAYTAEGRLINSGDFDNLKNTDAIEEITKFISKKEFGKATVQYKLRDWLVSRQRYWGTPIPIINCDECGMVGVPEKDLPVELPKEVKFGKGNPLLTNEEFVNTTCPKCGGKARRETDTMDTFFDSSWYFLRYTDNHNDLKPFEKEKVKYWMPVDQYIGGAEHACMHLIYARFFTKALRDIGLLDLDEPFNKLFNQGMLHGPDGHVMSKSRGNVVLPESVSKKYGIDTARFFLVSIASPDKDLEWSDSGIEGSMRFINRVIKYYEDVNIVEKPDARLQSKLNSVIKKMEQYIENYQYNLAIINIRELFDSFELENTKDVLEKFLKILAPFCPHITEELWEHIGNGAYLSQEIWPEADESKIDESFEAAEELLSNTVSDVKHVLELVKMQDPKKVTLIISHYWKYDVVNKIKEKISETFNQGEIIQHAMEKDHGKDIASIVQRVLRDPSLLPKVVLGQDREYETLLEAKENLEKKTGLEVEIVRAQDSKEEKAKSALPGKPSIIVN